MKMENLKKMIVEYFEDESYKNISKLNEINYVEKDDRITFEFTVSGEDRVSAYFDIYGLNIDNITTGDNKSILHQQLTYVLNNLQYIYKEYLNSKHKKRKTIYDLEGSIEENIDHYYELTSHGTIEKCWFWSTPKSWNKIWLGNAFLSKEEAFTIRERRRAKERILKSIKEVNGEYIPKLGDTLYFNQLTPNKELKIHHTKVLDMPLEFYIKNANCAKEVANKHYEDYLIYFGVKHVESEE